MILMINKFLKKLGNLLLLCLLLSSSVSCAMVRSNNELTLHKKFFVEHLINAPNKPSITNWYNPNTENSGIIKTTRIWYEGSNKCASWESTIDITLSLTHMGSPIRRTKFGTACVTITGRVEMDGSL